MKFPAIRGVGSSTSKQPLEQAAFPPLSFNVTCWDVVVVMKKIISIN